MFDDKTGWKPVTLGDVAREFKLKIDDPASAGIERCVRGDDFDSGEIKFKRWGNVPEDMGPTFTKGFKAGHLLYMTRRAYLRKGAVVDFDGVCANTTLVLEALPQKMLPELLPYIIQSDAFTEYAVSVSVGSTNPFTKWTDLKNFKFLLPPPQHQRGLVELMQGVEVAVESGQQALAGWRSLADTITETSFEAAPDRKKCGELCKEITVGVVVKPASYYVEEGVPALRSINVISNQIKLDNLVFFSEETNSLMHKSKLREDDVLIVRTGTPGSASGPGTTCVVPDFAVGYNCIDLVIVRPDSTLLNSTYLSYFLNSRLGKQQLFRHAVGLAQQHVNVGAVRQVEIPVMPLENQRNVVERGNCSAREVEFG